MKRNPLFFPSVQPRTLRKGNPRRGEALEGSPFTPLLSVTVAGTRETGGVTWPTPASARLQTPVWRRADREGGEQSPRRGTGAPRSRDRGMMSRPAPYPRGAAECPGARGGGAPPFTAAAAAAEAAAVASATTTTTTTTTTTGGERGCCLGWARRGAARRGARGRWRALWIGALCAAPTCLRLRPAVVVVAAAATVGVRGEQLLRVEQQEESSSFSPRPENPQWGAGSSPWVSAAWLFPCVYFMCFYFHGELGRADSRRRGWAARLPHRPRRVRDSAARPRLLFPRSSEGSEDLPAAPGPNRRRRAALSWRSGRQLGGSRAGVPSPLMTAPLPNPAAAAKLEGEPRVFLQLLRSTIEKIHNRIKFSQKPSLPTSHGVRGRAAFLLHSARQRKAVRRPLVTVWSFLTTVRSLLKFLLCWRCGVGASSCCCFCSERSYRRTDRQHSPSAQSWCCTSWKAAFSSFFLLFVSQQVSDQRFNFILFFLRPRSARMSS